MKLFHIPAFAVVTLALLLLLSCATPTKSKTESQPSDLAPVKAILHLGRYVVPGCKDYERTFPPRYPVLQIPTAQEAALAGYRPSPICTGTQERLNLERQRFGAIPPSEKTENWKVQLFLARKLADVDDSQSQSEDKQLELEEKIEQIDEEKVDRH